MKVLCLHMAGLVMLGETSTKVAESGQSAFHNDLYQYKT